MPKCESVPKFRNIEAKVSLIALQKAWMKWGDRGRLQPATGEWNSEGFEKLPLAFALGL